MKSHKEVMDLLPPTWEIVSDEERDTTSVVTFIATSGTQYRLATSQIIRTDEAPRWDASELMAVFSHAVWNAVWGAVKRRHKKQRDADEPLPENRVQNPRGEDVATRRPKKKKAPKPHLKPSAARPRKTRVGKTPKK